MALFLPSIRKCDVLRWPEPQIDHSCPAGILSFPILSRNCQRAAGGFATTPEVASQIFGRRRHKSRDTFRQFLSSTSVLSFCVMAKETAY